MEVLFIHQGVNGLCRSSTTREPCFSLHERDSHLYTKPISASKLLSLAVNEFCNDEDRISKFAPLVDNC